jgi:GTP-binding protein LepA
MSSTASASTRPSWSKSRNSAPARLGFFTASIKEVADTNVGDTITDDKQAHATATARLPPAQPVVFCGLFPVDASDFDELRAAMGKLRLNDASFSFEMETSAALGFGFRCGFLGLLHLEIIQERLSREFNLDLIATAPSVVYEIALTNGDSMMLHNPADLPDVVKIEEIREPWIKATILTPDEYLGVDPQALPGSARHPAQPELCRQPRHGRIRSAAQRSGVRFLRSAEVDLEGLCQLRLPPRRPPPGRPGQAQHPRQRRARRRAQSMLVHRTVAESRGRIMCEKLKELIPPHLFVIPIQAAIGGKIIARETVRAMRKDVTAKCYGGDATRKRKLLEKQKAGKKKMRQFGSVEIPQEAFIKALKMGDD